MSAVTTQQYRTWLYETLKLDPNNDQKAPLKALGAFFDKTAKLREELTSPWSSVDLPDFVTGNGQSGSQIVARQVATIVQQRHVHAIEKLAKKFGTKDFLHYGTLDELASYIAADFDFVQSARDNSDSKSEEKSMELYLRQHFASTVTEMQAYLEKVMPRLKSWSAALSLSKEQKSNLGDAVDASSLKSLTEFRDLVTGLVDLGQELQGFDGLEALINSGRYKQLKRIKEAQKDFLASDDKTNLYASLQKWIDDVKKLRNDAKNLSPVLATVAKELTKETLDTNKESEGTNGSGESGSASSIFGSSSRAAAPGLEDIAALLSPEQIAGQLELEKKDQAPRLDLDGNPGRANTMGAALAKWGENYDDFLNTAVDLIDYPDTDVSKELLIEVKDLLELVWGVAPMRAALISNQQHRHAMINRYLDFLTGKEGKDYDEISAKVQKLFKIPEGINSRKLITLAMLASFVQKGFVEPTSGDELRFLPVASTMNHQLRAHEITEELGGYVQQLGSWLVRVAPKRRVNHRQRGTRLAFDASKFSAADLLRLSNVMTSVLALAYQQKTKKGGVRKDGGNQVLLSNQNQIIEIYDALRRIRSYFHKTTGLPAITLKEKQLSGGNKSQTFIEQTRYPLQDSYFDNRHYRKELLKIFEIFAAKPEGLRSRYYKANKK